MAEHSTEVKRILPSIGITIVVLAVVGLFTVAGVCFFATKNLLSGFSSKQSFEKKIFPVVIFDPATFEDPTTLREIDLMLYSMWSALLSDNRKNYAYDEIQGMTTVPASELDRECFRLFGSAVTLSHKSFSDYENYYEYDEKTNSYKVPTINMATFYYPRVEEILSRGSNVYLKVGYVAPNGVADITFDGSVKEKEPTKYMLYELHSENSGYFIYAIRKMASKNDEVIISGGFQPEVGSILDTLRNPVKEDTGTDVYIPPAEDASQKELSSEIQGFTPKNSITGIYDIPLPQPENIEIKG